MRTSMFVIFILLLTVSCTQETTFNPSNERALYPVECDYSPILYGSIQIYSADSNQIESIDINYEYVPFGTYYVKLPNDQYHFKVTSDLSRQTSYSTLELNSGERAVDLWACESLGKLL